MGTIEEIIERERRVGWHWTLRSLAEGWQVEGHCSVDVLAANFPRPVTKADSMMGALVAAIRLRNQNFGNPTQLSREQRKAGAA
jgi:hypothetical protein